MSFCLVGFLFGGLLGVFVRVVVGFGFFSLNIKLSWESTENIPVVLTEFLLKRKHLTNTVLHFSGLVSSLTRIQY